MGQHIYRDDDDAAATARPVVVRRLQQPFDNISTTTTNTAFKSPVAGGMATTLGYPGGFTSAQWKELERQAMIYKYMVASVPVPPDLLLPFTHTADSSASLSPSGGGCGIFNLKFGNSKDPESGRCKRTDGKKWRCSRDVAPHQKYCERHMHRGRPRSRKPVEVLPNTTTKKTRLHLPTAPTSQAPTNPSPRSSIPPNGIMNPSSLVLDNTKNNEDISAPPYTDQPNRGLDWMMEGEMGTMDTSEQHWQQLMSEGSIYNPSTSSIFQQDYGKEPMNLLSLPDIGNSHNDEYNLFLNPYQPPRDFIDAWSNNNNPNSEDNNNESSVAANGNLSTSLNLSMAMAVGNSLDEEMGQIQMGLGGVRDTNHHHKSQVSSWLSPVLWMGSTPGGPLAEVLRPSSLSIGSNPGSPYALKNCDAISPRGTSACSPSGVLQRTMLSLSDSSVCNSPTLAATSIAAPEVPGLQWRS